MSSLPSVSGDGELTSHILDGPKPKWWKDSGLRRLMFWQLCILVSQATVGYDESLVGSFQAMQPWVEAMGHPTSSDVGLITSILFVGGFVGAFFAPHVADNYGRRPSIFVGSLLCTTGAAIQTASTSRGMFIGSRLILGLGISFTTNAGPTLLNELAHPQMRGQISATFNALWYVGSIIASWLTFGTGHLNSHWAWRIPSLVQGVPAVLVAISVAWIPESPRFLCSKGRIPEAQQILNYYHANGRQDDPLVAAELEQIITAIRLERESKMTSWSTMLKSRANRKRLGICIAVALLTLWNGQGVISYYFSPILTSIGITNTNQQTGINGGMQIWNLLCSLFGVYLSERIGRRPLWLASFIGMMMANVPLTIASARYAANGSKGAAYATVIFLFLYNAAFNIACNPLPYSYTTELLPYSIRTRGLGLFISISMAALTVNQYVNPIALDSIGFWYFVFYLGMLIIGVAIIYFFFPETKGYTLEELARVFGEDGVERVEVIRGVEVGSNVSHEEIIHQQKGV
ncbi:hexose transporter [Corynespora cassiicola Philippines]|uniref:Hexose transporter n=1 Tax=Corynespora cassiicola Philippines TaxID=1448308 RepID=A0A2T2N1V9_CORCC|nr:hexose transporter [Corynespora cassiicola Philippines]